LNQTKLLLKAVPSRRATACAPSWDDLQFRLPDPILPVGASRLPDYMPERTLDIASDWRVYSL